MGVLAHIFGRPAAEVEKTETCKTLCRRVLRDFCSMAWRLRKQAEKIFFIEAKTFLDKFFAVV